ncbi:winged helix-turn-helix domain-containing protein, partial [Paenarthrobacter aurescens]|nr:winged helix-turn-helix domain-containing protein [Paenarthrobacter aurescens]
EIASMILKRASQTVQFDEEFIQLSPREFQLLDFLVKNKGQVLSRDIILDRVWGYESDVSIKTIDATVKLLRKKLEKFNKQ